MIWDAGFVGAWRRHARLPHRSGRATGTHLHFEVIAADANLTREMFQSAYRFLSAQLGLAFDPARYSFGGKALAATA